MADAGVGDLLLPKDSADWSSLADNARGRSFRAELASTCLTCPRSTAIGNLHRDRGTSVLRFIPPAQGVALDDRPRSEGEPDRQVLAKRGCAPWPTSAPKRYPRAEFDPGGSGLRSYGEFVHHDCLPSEHSAQMRRRTSAPKALREPAQAPPRPRAGATNSASSVESWTARPAGGPSATRPRPLRRSHPRMPRTPDPARSSAPTRPW